MYVWHYNFVYKKWDFKQNCKIWIVWDWVFKKLIFESIENLYFQIASNDVVF
jgi:hypothetical protein